jgi:hypothetical protein
MSEAQPAFERRIELFRGVSEQFFSGGAWLAGATGLPGAVVAAAAGLTLLVVDQTRARFEAILARPVGVPDAGYSVPGPMETLEWFRVNPRYPELVSQFDAELMAADWRTLQRYHRDLYDVLVFQEPALLGAFAAELIRRDYRTIAVRAPEVRAALAELVHRAEVQSALRVWYELLTGQGPEADDAAARATFDAHWRGILAAAVGAGP